jgi:hypothetical protein
MIVVLGPPNASPSRSIAISVAVSFLLLRAITSLPLTFVKYGVPAGMRLSISDEGLLSSLLRRGGL